jgi:hypothetical protein
MAGTDLYSVPLERPRVKTPLRADHPVLRKLNAVARQVPRALARHAASDRSYASHPPIVVNSLPKSGTHLMMQIAEALPGATQYGSFIAQRPSWASWHRAQAEISARIAKIAPGEVLGAHLHHSPETAAALERLNALHLFIYRDPRAVLVSEVQYLALTARWNALHKRFAQAGDFSAQVDLAIDGDGTEALPDVATRYGPYLAWREAPNVLAIRYDEVICPTQRRGVLKAILHRHALLAGRRPDFTRLPQVEAAIRPWASHTYSGRDPERWRHKLTADQQTRLSWLV